MDSLTTKIRTHVLEMTHNAKCSHVGSCLSIADILAVLYGKILNVRPNEPSWEGRDKFVLSKGHACAALYAVLAERGFFPMEWLDKFYQDLLSGHASHYVPGVDVSTGSLGHGLSIGCGMAMATKSKVYALLGDGDCNEGATWEAAMFASQHQLRNLVVIVDYNKLQALGKTKRILNLGSLGNKWASFGWRVIETNGHNLSRIESALKNIPKWTRRPSCIIAHTVKGKGVSFMENKVEWHYKYPNDEELKLALGEL